MSQGLPEAHLEGAPRKILQRPAHLQRPIEASSLDSIGLFC